MLDGSEPPKPSIQPRLNTRVHLDITGRCNFRCRHCGASGWLASQDLVTFEDARSIVDQIASTGEGSIAITGGEPLLRDDILDVVEYCADRVKTILSTNASLVDERMAKRLAKLPVTFQVSLDGATAEVNDAIRGEGSFDATLRGIALLEKFGAGPRVQICRTLMGRPEEDIESMVELAERIGAGGIRFLCLARVGRAARSYDSLAPSMSSFRKFYSLYFKLLLEHRTSVVLAGGIPGLFLDVPEDRMWCHVGEMLEVSPEGKIYPCSMLARPEFELGTVWATRLQAAAESDKMMNLIAELEARRTTIEACRKCPFRNFCQAACPGMALADRGTIWAEDSLCQLRQELFEELFLEVLPRLGSGGPFSAKDAQV